VAGVVVAYVEREPQKGGVRAPSPAASLILRRVPFPFVEERGLRAWAAVSLAVWALFEARVFYPLVVGLLGTLVKIEDVREGRKRAKEEIADVLKGIRERIGELALLSYII